MKNAPTRCNLDFDGKRQTRCNHCTASKPQENKAFRQGATSVQLRCNCNIGATSASSPIGGAHLHLHRVCRQVTEAHLDQLQAEGVPLTAEHRELVVELVEAAVEIVTSERGTWAHVFDAIENAATKHRQPVEAVASLTEEQEHNE